MPITVTLCPPAVAAGAVFSQPTVKRKLAVHAPEYKDDGTFEDGLSYEDITSIHVQERVAEKRKRRLRTPVWTQSIKTIRIVLLAYLERRASMCCTKQCGPECIHKRKRAEVDERQRYVNVIKVLRQTKRSAHTSRPDIFLQILLDYYGVHLDASKVAQRSGVTSAFVRQFLYRINRVAALLGYTATTDEQVMGGTFHFRRLDVVRQRYEKLCAEQYRHEFIKQIKEAMRTARSTSEFHEHELALRREKKRRGNNN